MERIDKINSLLKEKGVVKMSMMGIDKYVLNTKIIFTITNKPNQTFSDELDMVDSIIVELQKLPTL